MPSQSTKDSDCPTGRSLKRFHRPNLLAYGYIGFKEKKGIQGPVVFQPCLPQRGPYEASEGIYPVPGKDKKLREGEVQMTLDR